MDVTAGLEDGPRDDSSGSDDGGPSSPGDSDSNDDRDDSAPQSPRCPSCGSPIATVTVTGPLAARVNPCGCRVPPPTLESD